MTTPLGQFPKPQAEQYQQKRKLFLVPTFAFAPGVPDEGQTLLDRYWTEVRDNIGSLERSLGAVSHVYYETLYSGGDEGLQMLGGLNPKAHSFVQALCQSTAKLEATEDRALVEESSDWQRCVSIGLVSQKVINLAWESLQEATTSRYERIASKIDETLGEGDAGALFIREDHRVQFPSDIQVFYVAPPALDALKRWIDDQVRAMPQPVQQQEPRESDSQEASPAEPEAEGSGQGPDQPSAEPQGPEDPAPDTR
ncbi:MAG: hypothetical protein VCA38_01500 [Roseibacillus sp.]